MTSAAVFDLDSTLADTSHRQWMIPLIKATPSEWEACWDGIQPTWDDYSMACADDEPIEATIWLANYLNATDCKVIIATGRSEIARDLTEEWLAKHGVCHSRLFMRPTGSRLPNSAFKLSVLSYLLDEGYDVDLFVEDFPVVADAIREEHPEIPVLLVNPGYHGAGGA